VLSTPPAFVLSQDQTLRECVPDIRSTPRERNHRTEQARQFTASSLCCISKEPRPSEIPEGIRMDGASTYLALIFGTLLSSQGTD
ncbi:hypothetical protein FGX00_01895, partial [Xylella fastidiosa subsp. multiplex]|nr:hypothetical protein [Xylella fastidiosa subsp. multiplex]